MRELLNRYRNSLSISSLDFRQAGSSAKEWLSGPVGLYLPRWPFLNSRPLEVIIKSYWALASGQGEQGVIRLGLAETADYQLNPFDFLARFDESWRQTVDHPLGFYAGLLAFDLYRFTEPLSIKPAFYRLPDYYVIIPAEALIIDHAAQTAHLLHSQGGWLPESRVGPSLPRNRQTRFSESKRSYMDKIEQIRELIRAGEVYQINYTMRITRTLAGSGFDFFRRIYQENPAPFSAYVNLPECEIVSNSPERFLSVDDRQVVTEPIKGTIKRKDDPEEDEQQRQALRASQKDAAELSMIVDLLRNDLSKVCRPGSVEVVSHKRLESFRNVHHLVSTIAGELCADRTVVNLLTGAFPGGSVSGCPKFTALQYISELEVHPRSFYTGNFLLCFPQTSQFDSSILIRTGIVQNRQIHFQVGGGIVIDSIPEDEYEECLAKADSFLKVTQRFDDDIS